MIGFWATIPLGWGWDFLVGGKRSFRKADFSDLWVGCCVLGAEGDCTFRHVAAVAVDEGRFGPVYGCALFIDSKVLELTHPCGEEVECVINRGQVGAPFVFGRRLR